MRYTLYNSFFEFKRRDFVYGANCQYVCNKKGRKKFNGAYTNNGPSITKPKHLLEKKSICYSNFNFRYLIRGRINVLSMKSINFTIPSAFGNLHITLSIETDRIHFNFQI